MTAKIKRMQQVLRPFFDPFGQISQGGKSYGFEKFLHYIFISPDICDII